MANQQQNKRQPEQLTGEKIADIIRKYTAKESKARADVEDARHEALTARMDRLERQLDDLVSKALEARS